MSEEETKNAAPQQDVAQSFEIRKIYVKDVSFESPNSPVIFTDGQWKPETNVQIKGSNNELEKGLYEVVLTLTVTVKQNDKTAFLIENQQAGIFAINGYPDESLQGILGAYCMEALFPYAREALDSLVIKGGFPPLMLNAIDFNALYQQQLQAGQAAPVGQDAQH